MKRYFVVSLLALVILIGCSSRRPELYLGDTTCSRPCWHGLIPGKSNIQESRAILQSLAIVDSNSISSEKWQHGITYLFWKFTGDLMGEGRAYFYADGSLRNISLTTNGLNLGTVIDMLGSPDMIWPFYTLPVDVGGVEFYLDLFYPAEGVVVMTRNSPTGFPERLTEDLSRNIEVTTIELYGPSDVRTYFREVDERDSSYIEKIVSSLRPWPGFGREIIRVERP